MSALNDLKYSVQICPVDVPSGWPVMLASLLETFYQLADTFWIGRLGGEQRVIRLQLFKLPFLFYGSLLLPQVFDEWNGTWRASTPGINLRPT